MKKLSLLAVILAMGTTCLTACNMGGPNSSGTALPEQQSIVVQSENEGEDTPAPCPDGNCNYDRMPFKKPSFKFKIPHGKSDKKGRDKFRRRPHRKPAPAPENPETPEEN